MMRFYFAFGLSCLLLLSGCGTSQPAWIGSSFVHYEVFRTASLEGQHRQAERAFAQAADRLRRNGQETAYARLWLHRQTIDFVLNRPLSQPDSVAIWAALDPQGVALQTALSTPFAVDALHVDSAHRPLLRSLQQQDDRRLARQLKALEDPFRQLLWVHILLRHTDLANDEIVDIGLNTARHQGWSAALVVLLQLESERNEASGNSVRAAEMRRQLDFIQVSKVEMPVSPHQ